MEENKSFLDNEIAALESSAKSLGQLEDNINDVKSVYRRSNTVSCNKKIDELVKDLERMRIEGSDSFSFSRDPHAIRNCQPCQLADTVSHRVRAPRDITSLKQLTETQARDSMSRATIAFGFLVNPRDNRAQLTRLFDTLIHPNHHYFVNVDGKQADVAKEIVSWIKKKWGISHPSFAVDSTRRVMRGGPGVMMSQLDEIYHFIKNDIHFTHFYHWSGVDYPLRSVDYIAAQLHRNGPFSYAEAFYQVNFRSYRILDEYVIPCYEENDGKGYLFRGTRHRARPNPLPFREFGSSP